MVWINEIKHPSKAVVHTVKRIQKGMILMTSDYDCFLFGNTQLCKHLAEAIEYWESQGNYGFELWIIPDKSKKLGFSIELGKECTYFTGNNLWTTDESTVNDENPFLVKTIKANAKATPNPLMREVAREEAKEMLANHNRKSKEKQPEAS